VNWDTIQRYFEGLGSGAYNPLQVAIELLLIGLSVNWCANVLHGTRGTRLLRGLLIVLVAVTLIVRVFSQQLGWMRLELLYRYFIIGLAFIALVAFQPELRRALIRAGEVRFLRRISPADRVIAALVEAAGYLSRNRYGALIAIQRDVGLANWAENGTQINAEISAKLLSSIFFPNSALHDLGVIVRGSRILAANCQFPSAEGGEADPSLGSRHRAAIGMSAESDALVLVVSEESGAISLAERGSLTRYLALDDLEQELQSRLGAGYGARPASRSFRKLSDFWRPTRRMLIVLPVTLVIWFLADQASLVTGAGVKVRLQIRHDPSVQVDVIDPPQPEFLVAARGPRSAVDALRALTVDSPLRLDWTIQGASPYVQPGRKEIDSGELANILEGLPEFRSRGLTIESVSPAPLRIDVHAVQTVQMPIRAETGGVRVTAEFDPREVSVTMRSVDLARLPSDQRVVTATLRDDLSDVSANQSKSLRRVPLERSIQGFQVLTLSPDEADANVRVIAQTEVREFAGVAVMALASPEFLRQYEIEADTARWLIDLRVEVDTSRGEPQAPRAFVNFSLDMAARAAEGEAEVQVILGPGQRLAAPAPKVPYKLERKTEATP